MREILVGIREDQERALNQLSKQERASRAALIREAIDALLAHKRSADDAEAFGLWGNRTGDGLDYERRIRDEW